MALHKVFCYGTLRPGNTDNTVVIPGVMYDLGAFPGVRLDHEGPGFTAEFVTVDDAGLARLDSYEGYYENTPEHSLYLRKPYLDGWIYEYNDPLPSYPVVDSGDWLSHAGVTSGRASYMVS